MLVTLLGMVMETRLTHSEKAILPILVTLLGIITDVRLAQRVKAPLSILVTLLGIVTEVIVELEKAIVPIAVTPSGITTSLSEPVYFINIPFSISKSDCPNVFIENNKHKINKIRFFMFLIFQLIDNDYQ